MRDLLCVQMRLGWNSTYLEIWSEMKSTDEFSFNRWKDAMKCLIFMRTWEDSLGSCWALAARSPFVMEPSRCGVPGPTASDTHLTTQPPWTRARGPRFHLCVCVCVFKEATYRCGPCLQILHMSGALLQMSDIYWTNMLLFLCLNLLQIVWKCMAIKWLIIRHGLHDQINQFSNVYWTWLFLLVSNTWYGKGLSRSKLSPLDVAIRPAITACTQSTL